MIPFIIFYALFKRFTLSLGQPLFRPHIPSLEHADQSLSLSLNDSLNSSGYVQHRQHDGDVFIDILRRDEVLKQKRSLNQAKAIEDELKDMSAHQVKALQISNTILKDSREKHIEELYRILVASTLTNSSAGDQIDSTNAENNNYYNEEGSNHVNNGVSETIERFNNFKTKILDFSLVQTDAMIPEVSTLLKDMRREYEEVCRLNRTETFEDREDVAEDGRKTPILVTFDEFRRLALRAIKHRNGTGKAYLCAPKKKPELALQMMFKNLKEETFHPIIDKTSQQLANRPKNSKFRDIPIEDILQAEGERMKSKVEIARFEKFIKDGKDFTYKPTLFKPPSYVKAKYRGMDIVTEEEPGEGGEFIASTHPLPQDGGYATDGFQMQQSGFIEDNSTIFTDDMMSLSNSILHEYEGPTLAPLASMSGGSNTFSRCMVHEDKHNVSYLSSGSPDADHDVVNALNNFPKRRPQSTVSVTNSSAHSELDIQPLYLQHPQRQDHHQPLDGVALDRFHSFNDTSSNSQQQGDSTINTSFSSTKPDASYLGMHMKLSTLKAKNPSHRHSHQRVNPNECGSLNTLATNSQASAIGHSEVEGVSYYSEVNHPNGSFKKGHKSGNPQYFMSKPPPPPLPHEIGSVDDTEYFDSREINNDFVKHRPKNPTSPNARSKSPSLLPPPPPPLPLQTKSKS